MTHPFDPHRTARHHLATVWTERISADYEHGRILNERALQHRLVRHLEDALPDHTVVVEPYLDVKGTVYYPDIAVLWRDAVTHIIEIKLAPHTYVAFEGDVEKLRKIHEAANWRDKKPALSFRIDPATGKYADTLGRFGSVEPAKTEYIFAVICDSGGGAAYLRDVSAWLRKNVDQGAAREEMRFRLAYGRVQKSSLQEFGIEPAMCALCCELLSHTDDANGECGTICPGCVSIVKTLEE